MVGNLVLWRQETILTQYMQALYLFIMIHLGSNGMNCVIWDHVTDYLQRNYKKITIWVVCGLLGAFYSIFV